MEAQDTTYEISSRYISDRKCTLPLDVYNQVAGWNRSRDYQRLAGCVSAFPQALAEEESARTLFQIEAFFKKNDSFTDPVAAKLAALISFEESELLCKASNDRLDSFYERRDIHAPFFKEIMTCQRYIESVLGPFRLFLDELPENIRFTAGATANLSRRNAQPFFKISRRMSCTVGATPYLQALTRYFGFGKFKGIPTCRNRVEFVPKSWKTLRTIACEPTGNMPLQLAFDVYAKRCLRKASIDLSDQTKNQELARISSIDDSLATLDVVDASGTVCYNVVALLFSYEWFDFLRSVRSSSYELYPALVQAYHKFSSMGNGATFCIETLVFAAACKAVGSKHFSVYGDDLIIEKELAPNLIELLAFLGFTVHPDKSFITGPIRESCGKVWFNGKDITPLYIRSVDGRKPVLSHLVNTMAQISKPYGSLATFLVEITIKEKLALVPLCKDSMCGVWITPHDAYARKLIITRKNVRTSAKLSTPKGYSPEELKEFRTRARELDKSQWIVRFKGYSPCDKDSIECYDWRALFLWHLRAFSTKRHSFPPPLPSFIWDKFQDRDDRVDGPMNLSKRIDRYITSDQPVSRYGLPSHRYRKRWLHWFPVVFGATINQERFIELLLLSKDSSSETS